MDLQEEIRKSVRQAVMEEINGLAIRATIREKIEASGITHKEIREIIRETADSYFRSAMDGNVEEKIQKIFEKKVSETIDREIDKVIGSITFSGRDKIRSALNEAAAQKIRNRFDISVSIKEKDNVEE